VEKIRSREGQNYVRNGGKSYQQCCGPDQNSDPDPGCIYYLDTTGSLDPVPANLALYLRAGFSFKGLKFHRELSVPSWKSKIKILGSIFI
jgi:hypothetical protein